MASPTKNHKEINDKIPKEWKSEKVSIEWRYNPKKEQALEIIKVCNESILLFPNDAFFFYTRGLARRVLDETTEALKDFTKAIELNPNDDDVYYYRALLHERFNYESFDDITKAIELNPNNPLYYYTRASLGQSNSNYSSNYEGQEFGQIDDLNMAIQLNPNNDEYFFFRGALFFPNAHCSPWVPEEVRSTGTEEELKFALNDFNEVIRLNPNFNHNGYNIYTYICNAKYYCNDFDGALEAYAKSKGLQPKEPNPLEEWWGLYQRRSQVKAKLADYKGALDDINIAEALCSKELKKVLHPNTYPLAFGADKERLLDSRARIQISMGDYNSAIKDYSRIIESSPNKSGGYASRGETKTIIGNLKGAIEDFSLAIQNSINSELYYKNCINSEFYFKRGCALKAIGDPFGAIIDFMKAIDTIIGSNKKSQRFYYPSEDYESYKENEFIYFDVALKKYYLNLGLVKHSIRDYISAISDFEVIIKEYMGVYDDVGIFYYNRGLSRYAIGDYEGAIQDFDVSIYKYYYKKKEHNYEYYLNRGLAKHNFRDFEGAFADFTHVINNPADSIEKCKAYNYMGLTYQEIGNKYHALTNFYSAIDIQPDNYEPYFNRGLIKLSLDDFDGATEDFNIALKLNPNNAEVLKNLELAKNKTTPNKTNT